MKTLRRIPLFLTLGSLLALTATFGTSPVLAGPSPQFGSSRVSNPQPKEIAAAQTADSGSAICAACKTMAVREATHNGPAGKGGETWTNGSQHTCAHCGGSMTVAKGKVSSSMADHCAMCVTQSASHCMALAEAGGK